MKKLFFLAFFMAGLFITIQAQPFSLKYYITNNTSTTWDMGLADSDPTPTSVEELNILPGEEREGFISNFHFDLYWKGGDGANCDFDNMASGVVPPTLVGPFCNPNVSYVYEIVHLGGPDYTFSIKLFE